jgi:uncharacterized repeat protein (TIGR01451 family)
VDVQLLKHVRWVRRRAVRSMVALAIATATVPFMATPASAAASLSITPNTWNVIGLDSNSVGTGPNQFLSGARICNTGNATATNVQADYTWDTTNTYISLYGPASYDFGDLAASACVNAYFNVQVSRTTSAFDTTRRFHITATADALAPVSTPTPRELYVEHLVSQNRNSVLSVTSNATPVSGGYSTLVGGTYTFTVTSKTATQGYEQLSSFLDWPGSIFQVLSVSQDYAVAAAGVPDPNTTVYADACGWRNDPTVPATYRSCVGSGKAGGDPIVTTYTIKVISAGSSTVSEMIYDFSGSSFHYNSDEGTGVGSFSVEAVEPVVPANLTVSKSDSQDPVTAGTDLTYTITVDNEGAGPAQNVTLSDPVPAGTSFSSATGGGTLGGGTVTWNLGTIAAGGATSVTLTVHVNAGRTTDLSNTATVATTSTETDTGDNQAVEPTVVQTSADLSIVVSDLPDPVAAGGTLTYTLTVANAGPSDATAVGVTDTLPADVTYSGATPSQGSCSQLAGLVTCSLGTLAAGGSATIDITVVPTPAAVGTTLTTTAAVSSTTPDPVPANDSDTEDTDVLDGTDLSVSVSDSVDPVTAGEQLTYTIVVSNAGPPTATGVTLDFDLPAGTSFVSASDGGTAAAGSVTWALPDLDAGDSTTVTVIVLVASSQTATLSATASISADQPDTDTSNDTATEPTDVTTSADLSLVKQAGDDAVAGGDQITYTIAVSNLGPSDAQSVTITDPLPDGVAFVSATDGGTESAGVVSWNLGTVTNGQSRSVTLVVEVDPDVLGDLVNTATAASTTDDPDTGDLTDSVTVTVVAPDELTDVEVTKTANVDEAEPGDEVVYTIRVINHGPSAATGVVVSDVLPAGLAYEGQATSTGTYDPTSGAWTVGSLGVGDDATLLLTTKITDGAMGSWLVNHARLAHVDQTDARSSDDVGTQVLGLTGSNTGPTPSPSPDPDPPLAGTGFTAGGLLPLIWVLVIVGVSLVVVGAPRARRPERDDPLP